MSLRRFHFAATAAAALAACCATVAAAGPWGLAPGEYYTELTGSFYSSGSAYDGSGDRHSTGGLEEQRALTSITELGWKKHWSVQLSLPALSKTVREADGTTGTSSGFGDFGFGLRWQFVNGASARSLQLQWEAPAGYNKQLEPGLGDGLQKLSASFQGGGAVGGFGFWQLGAGMRFQYNSFTGLWDQITYPPSKWLWAEHITTNGAVGVWFDNLQVAGLFATDLAGYSEEDPTRVTEVVVGPRLAYAVDERVQWVAGMWYTPSGMNSPHQETWYTGVSWRMTKLGRQQGILGSPTHP